jgi:hypothetical protein
MAGAAGEQLPGQDEHHGQHPGGGERLTTTEGEPGHVAKCDNKCLAGV